MSCAAAVSAQVDVSMSVCRGANTHPGPCGSGSQDCDMGAARRSIHAGRARPCSSIIFGFSRVLAAAGMQAEELENALRGSAARYAQEAGMDGKDNTGSEVEPEPECCRCPFTAYSVLPCILLPCAISRAPRDVGDQAFRTAQRARCTTLPVTTARRASECPDRGLALLS